MSPERPASSPSAPPELGFARLSALANLLGHDENVRLNFEWNYWVRFTERYPEIVEELPWNHLGQTVKRYGPPPPGSMACAIGWTALLNPADWVWLAGAFPVLLAEHARGQTSPVLSGARWFGITYEASEHLFAPSGQRTRTFGGKVPTAEEEFGDGLALCDRVALNVEDFLERWGTHLRQGKAFVGQALP